MLRKYDNFVLLCPIYLRCNVVRCTTESCCSVVPEDVLFTHTKVSNLHMTVTIQQNIVQLQISVTNHENDVNRSNELCYQEVPTFQKEVKANLISVAESLDQG